jgi:hypothetical protein
MRKLRLAADLALPLDAVTQTFLIVGKRGSGKSNTAARFVEQLHHARLPFVVLDPVDTWWGLKAGRKKGERGLDDVYVFGGRRQDLPLNAGDGALIADVLCEHRVSMVLSVKHLSGRERSTFMVAFAQTLFQKWGGGPLHVVLEEAHELAPQMAGGRGRDPDGETAMLGAFKRLWKLGRASGIGGTAVTQRPASLSKDITTQSEILIAHRVIGPQDVKAVGEWVKYHGERLDILAELPTLPTGQAFIWSPEFPEGQPIGLTRTTVLLRETYDSASTPKVGEIKSEPRELAKVDLDKLRAKMATTIEKAKANDAGELRKQLVAVRGELEQLRKTKEPKPGKTVVETEEILTQSDRALLTRIDDALATLRQGPVPVDVDKLTAAVQNAVSQVVYNASSQVIKAVDSARFQELLRKLTLQSEKPSYEPRRESLTPSKATGGPGQTSTRSARRPPEPVEYDGAALPPGEVACLTAVLQYPGLERKRLGVLTTYKRSTRDVYIAKLVAKGLVDANGNGLQATDAGRKAMDGKYQPLPTGDALVEYWRQRLPEGERKTLDVLLEHRGRDVTRTAIDEATGYARSTRDVYLTKLKARGLVDFVGSGKVRASAELVER